MSERITSVKRVELNSVSEGYDADCFAYVRPATYEDQKEILQKDIASLTEVEQLDYQLSFVKQRFISGKIKILTGTEFQLTDMTDEDTSASVAITDALYAGIMGWDLDPKAVRKAANEAALHLKSESPTETTSLENSPAE